MHMDAQLQQFEFGCEGIALPLMAERLAAGLLWQVQQPGIVQWWREYGVLYPQKFRNHVDGLIREGEAAG